MIGYAYGALGGLMGFLAGFGATLSHILGDIFTYEQFKPFLPFSSREISFKLFRSSNKAINNGLLGCGIFVFIISYEPSILWQFLDFIRNYL